MKTLLRLYFCLCLLFAFLHLFSTRAAEQEDRKISEKKQLIKEQGLQQQQPQRKRQLPDYRYGHIERYHHYSEHLYHLGGIYLASWALYPLTQAKVFREKGSWKNYHQNFGKLVFDQDEPFWNWLIHPLSGAHLFLYYRANGYTPTNSLGMSFLSSALFEFAIEIYTEKASIQDLYQTPVVGSILGFGFEKISFYLLNTGNLFAQMIGHLINPYTLFWFYEGKIKLLPKLSRKSIALTLQVEF